jgi:CubicO group peptidase (beta-lactamase class C family)
MGIRRHLDFAGKAVKAVTGQKLGRYMKENIFDPLGMKDTGFKIGEQQRKRLAKIHARTPDGLVATDTEIPQEPEFEMGGGGLYGTVGDYLKFAQVFLHGGTFNGAKILTPETIGLMGQNAAGDVRVRPLPPISNDVDFIDGMQWGFRSLSIRSRCRPDARRVRSLGPGSPIRTTGSILRKAWPASTPRKSCRSST